MAVINSPPDGSVDTFDKEAGTLGPPSEGWRNFIMAVYNICASLTQSGTTAQRPTKLLWQGRPYFDTTLGLPIWYKTAGWVNATGAAV